MAKPTATIIVLAIIAFLVILTIGFVGTAKNSVEPLPKSNAQRDVLEKPASRRYKLEPRPKDMTPADHVQARKNEHDAKKLEPTLLAWQQESLILDIDFSTHEVTVDLDKWVALEDSEKRHRVEVLSRYFKARTRDDSVSVRSQEFNVVLASCKGQDVQIKY